MQVTTGNYAGYYWLLCWLRLVTMLVTTGYYWLLIAMLVTTGKWLLCWLLLVTMLVTTG